MHTHTSSRFITIVCRAFEPTTENIRRFKSYHSLQRYLIMTQTALEPLCAMNTITIAPINGAGGFSAEPIRTMFDGQHVKSDLPELSTGKTLD